jgi:O-antigen ligase
MILAIFLETLLFFLPASLVLALEKITLFGLPLYFLEVLFLVFILASIGLVTKEDVRMRWRGVDIWIVLGGVLFALGAVVSTLSQSQSATLTSLGQLKSWFGFPLVFIAVLYSFKKGNLEERVFLYSAWLVGTVIITLTAFYGYSYDLLTYDGRLAFPYSSANFLAFLIAPGILLANFFLFQASARLKKWPYLFLIGSFFIVLYFTHSYNTWLALIFGASVSLLSLYWKKGVTENLQKVAITVIGMILLFGGFIFLEQGESKWQSLFLADGRSSLDSRLMIWQSATSILRDNWLGGIGVGNFERAYLAYQPHFTPYLEWAVPQPHNLWLAVWLQTGLIGLAGFILILGRFGILLWMKLRSISNKGLSEGMLLVGLWVFLLVYGLFDTPYFRNDLAFLFWLQVLLTYGYVKEED